MSVLAKGRTLHGEGSRSPSIGLEIISMGSMRLDGQTMEKKTNLIEGVVVLLVVRHDGVSWGELRE